MGISVNEKYSPFPAIRYVSADINPDDWEWLSLQRVRLVRVNVARRGFFGITLAARIEKLDSQVCDATFIDTAELYTPYSRQCAEIAGSLRKHLVVSVVETIRNHITSRIPPYSSNTRFVLSRADLVVALTQRARQYALSVGVDEDKLKVIPQGVDLERFKPPEHEPSSDIVRILFVSELIERRGLLELLRAFERVHSNTKNVELWVVGSGPLRKILETLTKKYPVKIFGHIPYRELPLLYQECGIFCLPGKDVHLLGVRTMEDGQYTISLLEAMASGLPLIVSNSGAYPELVGPENLVVGQREVNELYAALMALVEDEKLRKRLGQDNRQRAEQMFDARRQCAMYERSLMSLV